MGGSSLFKSTLFGGALSFFDKNPKWMPPLLGVAAKTNEITEPIKKVKDTFKQVKSNVGSQKGSLLTPVSNQSKSLLGA